MVHEATSISARMLLVEEGTGPKLCVIKKLLSLVDFHTLEHQVWPARKKRVLVLVHVGITSAHACEETRDKRWSNSKMASRNPIFYNQSMKYVTFLDQTFTQLKQARFVSLVGVFPTCRRTRVFFPP